MSSNLHRNSTEANKHTPKGFDLAVNNSRLVRDERGQSRYIDNLLNERAENLVDGNSAPPTTTEGHVYVLIDEGSGSVHVDWQGANYNDIVRVQGGVWGVITPVSGYLILNKTDNKYYKFNGTIWEEFIPDSENIYTNNGTTGSNRTVTITDVLNFNGGKVALNSTANGFLMNRVTTLQMNSIATPSTNELVFNTDLNGLYRYNGSSWVALSSGYGIIGVYSGSGNGTPVFFATLQSALETCKASGGYFTVKLYSNITITSAIEIYYTGSGVGKSYLFRQLTIDFNGFSVTNAQANASHGFDVRFNTSASSYQELRLINGSILRNNSSGFCTAFLCNTSNQVGSVQMSKMYIYNQNSVAVDISVSTSSDNSTPKVCDLGGSVFVSNSTADRCAFFQSNTYKNFSAYHSGSNGNAIVVGALNARVKDFSAETTGGGRCVEVLANSIVSNFFARANSQTAVWVRNTTAEAHNFWGESVSGIGTEVTGGLVTNFTTKSTSWHGLLLNGNGSIAKNGFCINNTNSEACVQLSNFKLVENINGRNLANGLGGRIWNSVALQGNVDGCKFISNGGIGGELQPSNSQFIIVKNSEFISELDANTGHACRVSVLTGGQIQISNSNFIVRNSGANAVNATVATTIKSFGNTHNEVASTPINANVTITALASF